MPFAIGFKLDLRGNLRSWSAPEFRDAEPGLDHVRDCIRFDRPQANIGQNDRSEEHATAHIHKLRRELNICGPAWFSSRTSLTQKLHIQIRAVLVLGAAW